jgi:hypothetical protein
VPASRRFQGSEVGEIMLHGTGPAMFLLLAEDVI